MLDRFSRALRLVDRGVEVHMVDDEGNSWWINELVRQHEDFGNPLIPCNMGWAKTFFCHNHQNGLRWSF